MNSEFFVDFTMPFHFSDQAGIVFFGRTFEIVSQCFERFIVASGIPWEEWYRVQEVGAPLRHASADYLRPMQAGQTYQVRVSIDSLGSTSLVVRTRICQGDDLFVQAKTVHAFMNFRTGQKCEIPSELRQKLEKWVGK